MFTQKNKDSIFVLTWGATMRLANFFIVIHETAETVTVAEIESSELWNDGCQTSVPKLENGQPFYKKDYDGNLRTFRAKKHSIGLPGNVGSIKGKFMLTKPQVAYKWDCEPVSICTID